MKIEPEPAVDVPDRRVEQQPVRQHPLVGGLVDRCGARLPEGRLRRVQWSCAAGVPNLVAERVEKRKAMRISGLDVELDVVVLQHGQVRLEAFGIVAIGSTWFEKADDPDLDVL